MMVTARRSTRAITQKEELDVLLPESVLVTFDSGGTRPLYDGTVRDALEKSRCITFAEGRIVISVPVSIKIGTLVAAVVDRCLF